MARSKERMSTAIDLKGLDLVAVCVFLAGGRAP